MTDQDSYAESLEVNWQMDSTTVYGTMVRPSGPGPFPAVVMVAGSGPTDRDWNSPLLPGHQWQRASACGGVRTGRDRLPALRQACFRPPCSREHATADRQAQHAKPCRRACRSRPHPGKPGVRHVTGRIFALANSEGTLHALNYQLHSPAIPFAGLVLIGPPGRAVGTVARSQLAAQAAARPKWGCVAGALRCSHRPLPGRRAYRPGSVAAGGGPDAAAESGNSGQPALCP